MKRVREQLGESLAAFRDNFANPQLRRLQLAGMGSVMGLWAYSIALAVYAYDVGGAKAVGLVTLVRAVPAAISAPFTSTLADRLPRVPFMVVTNLGRASAIGCAGVVALAGGSQWLVYTLAGLASILGTAFMPAGRSPTSPGHQRSSPQRMSSEARSKALEPSRVRRSAAHCSRSGVREP